MSNTFGTLFRLTTFGESHGPAIGGIVDGMPAGIIVDTAFVQSELNRRRPGDTAHTSPRQEKDEVRFLSGLFEGKTTGAPIAFIVENTDAQPTDYELLRNVFRPSHADYTYYNKYGIRDFRGSGRASARTTLSRVVAGALAKLALLHAGVEITAHVECIGGIPFEDKERVKQLLHDLREAGDTVGGIVTCVAKGVPVGWGEPEADKLQASLAHAMMSIPAAKGFEYGDGFAAASHRGSEHNDIMTSKRVDELTNKEVVCPDAPLSSSHEIGKYALSCPSLSSSNIFTSFASNHDGGIQGGISNGQDICFRVAFKPIPTLLREQKSVDTQGNAVTIRPRGRHDMCAVLRAVPIVEAATAMVLMDHWLLAKASEPCHHDKEECRNNE